MIEAVLFDMDGLMFDSQPYWQMAQVEILPQVSMLAAKAAQMITIVIPDYSTAGQKHFVIAGKQLRSLEELTPEILQSL